MFTYYWPKRWEVWYLLCKDWRLLRLLMYRLTVWPIAFAKSTHIPTNRLDISAKLDAGEPSLRLAA